MDIATQIFREWRYFNADIPTSIFQQDRRGLVFHGPPRTGKTQLACELTRRLLGSKDELADAKFISAVQWCSAASAKAKACELDGWAQELLSYAWRTDCEPGVVIIDDIDKVRATPSIQSELFNLLETITANEMTLIVTTNTTAGALANKFDPEFGRAIVARIMEFCVPVNFSGTRKPTPEKA
jgi:DNA replication protein DnaC